jgi:uncharacterized hydrophobic protein (TIGR00271 family)
MDVGGEAGIVHLRLIVPRQLAERVLATVRRCASAHNIVRLEHASLDPPGDLVLCDVAREEASVLVAQLRETGLDRQGSISIEAVDTAISEAAVRAEAAAAGSPSDAILWEEVEARTSESAHFSFSFGAFMVLATLIAAIGIMIDSQILIIGAMVVGPEFGPLAGFCVALVQRRLPLARLSAAALVAGFPLAIAVTLVFTLVLRGVDVAPETLAAQSRPATLFIAHPDTFSVLVALLAGAAGMLSLTTAKSAALLGVLISVTTIPAAANVGVASAYADWTELGGAAAQLGINLACIVVAGSSVLAAQRSGFARRLRRAAARAV